MTDLYQTEKLRAGMNRLQIAKLIDHLVRSADLLTADIDLEETRTGVRDQKSSQYSQMARQLRIRRDNLLATVALLEVRVAPSEAA
jgi:hypothetical protein